MCNRYFRCCLPLLPLQKLSLKMLKLQMIHQQVYVHIAATTTPHSDEPPQLHNPSHFFFLDCEHKHLYQYMIQRDLIQLKCVMYYLSRYVMYSPYTLYTCAQARKKTVCDCATEESHHCVVLLQHCVHVLVDV